MITWADLWSGGRAPNKPEIEQVYRMAYLVDPKLFRPSDVVDFGIDVQRLKEYGQVRMKKDLPSLRKHAKGLWERMDNNQKTAFVMADVKNNLEYIGNVIRELEKMIGPLPEAHTGLMLVSHIIYAKIPKPLRERLDTGFGKWKAGNGNPES